jgi:hypothetical protein
MEFTEKLNLKTGHSDDYLAARIPKIKFTGQHDFKNMGIVAPI